MPQNHKLVIQKFLQKTVISEKEGKTADPPNMDANHVHVSQTLFRGTFDHTKTSQMSRISDHNLFLRFTNIYIYNQHIDIINLLFFVEFIIKKWL